MVVCCSRFVITIDLCKDRDVLLIYTSVVVVDADTLGPPAPISELLIPRLPYEQSLWITV